MAYFKIGNTDISQYVSSLVVSKKANYNALQNAHGDTVIDYINSKRTLKITLRPLTSAEMSSILALVSNFSVQISYRDPQTQALSSNVNCIVEYPSLDYYTIQQSNTTFKKATLTFSEL